MSPVSPWRSAGCASVRQKFAGHVHVAVAVKVHVSDHDQVNGDVAET
jgi:hypothetical protein